MNDNRIPATSQNSTQFESQTQGEVPIGNANLKEIKTEKIEQPPEVTPSPQPYRLVRETIPKTENSHNGEHQNGLEQSLEQSNDDIPAVVNTPFPPNDPMAMYNPTNLVPAYHPYLYTSGTYLPPLGLPPIVPYPPLNSLTQSGQSSNPNENQQSLTTTQSYELSQTNTDTSSQNETKSTIVPKEPQIYELPPTESPESDMTMVQKIAKELSRYRTANAQLINDMKPTMAQLSLLENKSQTLQLLDRELHEQKLLSQILDSERNALISAIEAREQQSHYLKYQLAQLEKIKSETKGSDDKSEQRLTYPNPWMQPYPYNPHALNIKPPIPFGSPDKPKARPNKRSLENGETPEVKRQRVWNTPHLVNMELQNIRRRIPERLNSGYVIHALLFCALNRLGAECRIVNGLVEEINIHSYMALKTNCLFVIKYILKKKTSVSCDSNWDKTLRQRWFDGWALKEAFTVTPKQGRKEAMSQLLGGHSLLPEEEKRSLLTHIQTWYNFEASEEVQATKAKIKGEKSPKSSMTDDGLDDDEEM